MKQKDNTTQKKQSQEESFKIFLLAKTQRLDWLIICGICLIAYIVLRICYPYPATVTDSGGYVSSAMQDRFIFYRPFGYSFFLQIIYSLSSSIHAVFIVQMLLYLISTAFFGFTIKYFFPPTRKAVWYILLVFLTFSPIAFFMSNSIMSDMLFAALIYIMLSSFIFIVMKKSWIALILFSLSLFFSLSVRYSAIIFPFVFLPFLLTIKNKIRWIAIIAVIFLTIVFYKQMQNNMRETTGFNQYSTGFDGWQLANNAMHILPYIDLPPAKIQNPQMRDLHQFSVLFKDTIKAITNNGQIVLTTILWDNNFPLKQYVFLAAEKLNEPYPKLWIYFGSGLYRDYGRYLITHYPVEFMKYYLFPNTLDMFYPIHTGIMHRYIALDAKDIINWYNLSEKGNFDAKYDIYGKFITKSIPISSIFMWVIILCIGCYVIINRKKIKFGRDEKIIFWTLFTFGAIYYSSTIFASPIELRYWLPMKCIQFSFCYILLNKIFSTHE